MILESVSPDQSHIIPEEELFNIYVVERIIQTSRIDELTSQAHDSSKTSFFPEHIFNSDINASSMTKETSEHTIQNIRTGNGTPTEIDQPEIFATPIKVMAKDPFPPPMHFNSNLSPPKQQRESRFERFEQKVRKYRAGDDSRVSEVNESRFEDADSIVGQSHAADLKQNSLKILDEAEDPMSIKSLDESIPKNNSILQNSRYSPIRKELLLRDSADLSQARDHTSERKLSETIGLVSSHENLPFDKQASGRGEPGEATSKPTIDDSAGVNTKPRTVQGEIVKIAPLKIPVAEQSSSKQTSLSSQALFSSSSANQLKPRRLSNRSLDKKNNLGTVEF